MSSISSTFKIYHNNRCSKSRAAIKLLNEYIGPDKYKIHEYLKEPLEKNELRYIFDKNKDNIESLLRTDEYNDKSIDEIIDFIIKNPYEFTTANCLQ